MTSAPDFSAVADLGVPFAVPHVDRLDDSALLQAQRTLAEVRRRVDAASAAVAGEIAYRSRRELGHEGLAQRLGARSAEKLVQTITGGSTPAARTLVRIGSLLTAAPPGEAAEDPPEPWLVDVAAAVRAGAISVEAADAIRAGIGTPDDAVTAEALTATARALVEAAPRLTLERLIAGARDARAALDLDGVAERERLLRERRYLHLIRQPDGMTRLSGLLDPESAAIVTAAYDSATSPRRGGPRFVDPAAAHQADELVADDRTLEQLALDAVVDLIRVATLVDEHTVLATRRPTVQVLVTEGDLRARHGIGRIEGQTEAVSIATVERHACGSGFVPIAFDRHGAVLDVGRDQRLFTPRQRVALAARDGGCRFPGCDRPPSWTEAHHITEWSRGGRTDVADGVLLCRHHHLLIHNNGWRVQRTGAAEYSVVPPPDVDSLQRPIPAPTKSRTLERALAAG